MEAVTQLAIDALDTTIPPAAIRAAGYVGVLHYLRNLTTARVQELHAAGLGVGTIFETNAAESLGGTSAGIRDGQIARQYMTALNQPVNTLHIVNVADFKPTAPQLPIIQEYYQAYYSETHQWQTLPYATGFVLNSLGVGWQNPMDDNGVPGNIVVPNAAIYQRVTPTLNIPNASYDEDVIIHPVVWWLPPVPIPSPTPGVHVSGALPLGVKVLAASIAASTPERWDVLMVADDGNCYHKWWVGGSWHGPDMLNKAV